MRSHLATLAILGLLLLPAQVFAAPSDLVRTIPNPNTGLFWGAAVSPCGDGTILVGSTSNWLGGPDVPVYRVNVLTGQTVQTYSEPAQQQYAQSDTFGGMAIALAGDYVLVSVDATVGELSQAGRVHVYDAATGTYLRAIDHPTPEESGFFGAAIAVAGNQVVVGARPRYDFYRAAYVMDPSTGAVARTLPRPQGSNTEFFGWSLGTFGQDVLIGGSGGPVYRMDPLTGVVKATFVEPNGEYGGFGCSLAGAGDKVLVGYSLDNTQSSESGSVHVFSASGQFLHTIYNPDPDAGDWFGMTVAVYQDRYALIGAPMDNGCGIAYLYDLEDYSLLATFSNPNPGASSFFGQRLAWENGAAVITAWRDDSGTVYVYQGFVPEPATMSLLAVGGLAMLRRKRSGIGGCQPIAALPGR